MLLHYGLEGKCAQKFTCKSSGFKLERPRWYLHLRIAALRKRWTHGQLRHFKNDPYRVRVPVDYRVFYTRDMDDALGIALAASPGKNCLAQY